MKLVLIAFFMLILVFPAAGAPAAGHPDQELLTALGQAGKDTEPVKALLADLKHEDEEVRARAVQLLWDAAGGAALDQVIGMTRDPKDNVALVATRILRESEEEAAVEAIRAALGSPDRSASFKAQVVSTLADFSDSRFITETGALLSSENVALRRTVLLALQALGTPEVFPYFMAATSDGDLQVSTTAVAGLAKLGNPAALPRVALLLESDQPRLVVAAAQAIPALGGTGQYSKQLAALIREGSRPALRGILATLQQHPGNGALPLLKLAGGSEDPGNRVLVIRALEADGSPEASQLLLGYLKDSEERVRASAVQSLGDRGDAAALAAITPLSNDSSARVRSAVAIALGSLGSRDGLKTLRSLAVDKDISVKLAAISATGQIGGDDAFPILKARATDPDPYVRAEVVRGLAATGGGKALALIRALAADSDLTVRITSINELGRLRDRGSMELLKQARSDQAEAVRTAARTALAMMDQ